MITTTNEELGLSDKCDISKCPYKDSLEMYHEGIKRGEKMAMTYRAHEMSTEYLRAFKKEIEQELSRRHKAKEDEKCNCWTCGHCFYDENAHTSLPRGFGFNRGGYKCMAYGKKGKIIPTKHKAPCWCPIGKGDEE